MKRQPMEWETLFANDAVNKDLISRIYINNSYNSTKITKPTQSENGQKTLIGISLKKTYR